MKKKQALMRGGLAAVIKGMLAILFVGVGGQLALGQDLIQNGMFSTDLTNWKTEGTVTGGGGKATLSEGGTTPELYQVIDVSGTTNYAYELRFDLYVGDMSSSAGTGDVDRGRLSIIEGGDAATLTKGTAVSEQVLLEASAAGPILIAANISGVPNPALGSDWYSVVVEFVSDYDAIAPFGTVLNRNNTTDSSMTATNIRLYALNRGRLSNISNRGPIGAGANIMIPGFAIAGSTNKNLVIRGVGPTLGSFGVGGTIEDPSIGLFPQGATSPLLSNDNWEQGSGVDELKAAFATVGAFPLNDGSLDAALLVKDLAPGVYTVQVGGVGGGVGVGLAEIYDLNASLDGPTELTNISNRGFIGQGQEVQIPGFVIGGTRGKKVLIRAVGPRLADFGVAGALEDPVLELFRQGTDGAIASNDNWGDNPNVAQIVATSMQVGAFDLVAGSADAAVLTALEPGQYTAVARGKGELTGVALVEVYVVTANQRPVPISNTLYVNSGQSNTLDMDELLGNDLDADGDTLKVMNFTSPPIGTGTLVLNNNGDLVYTAPIGFFGESVFSYTVTDGEYESVPATVAVQVTPSNAAIWSGGGSNANFSDPANWRNGVVPGPTDPVWISEQGEYTITIDQNTTIASLRAGSTGSMVTVDVRSGRTLTAAGGIRIQPGSVLDINNGTVATNQDVIILGKLTWDNGEMNGNAATIIEVGAVAEIGTGQNRLTGNRRFINRGTVMQSGSGHLYSAGGSNSTVTNAENALWDLMSGNGITFAFNDNSSLMDFINLGELNRSSPTGIIYFGTSGGTSNFTNTATGSLSLAGGIFQFNGSGSGTHSGTIAVASGAVLKFARGSHTFQTGATISDVGDVEITGTGTTVTYNDSASFESLKISNGTLIANGTLTVKRFVQTNGTFSSDQDLIVTESLTWTGGIQTGEGTTTIGAEGTGSMTSGFLYLRGGRGILNNGETIQGGSAAFYADQGSQSTITNGVGATWNLASNNGTRFAYQDGSSTMNWVNNGTMEKPNTTGIVYFGNSSGTSNFTNTGVLSILGGTLQFDGQGTGTHDGDLSVASGAVALFNRGTHSFDLESTFSENGELHVAGAAIVNLPQAYTFESLRISNGTLKASGDLTVGTYTQTAGTLDSEDDLTVTDSFTWNGGFQTGAGTTIIAATATGTSSSGTLYLRGNRDLTNLGEMTQGGGAQYYTDQGSQSTITNGVGATWNLSLNNGYTFAYQDGSSTMNWVNLGTLEKTNATSLNYFGTTSGTSNFTNEGTISILGGTLQWNGNGFGTHKGELSIASGAISLFARGTHTFEAGATITDTGTVQLNSSAVVTLPGAFSFETLIISNGTLNAAGALTVDSFSQVNGTFNSAANLTVDSELSWTGGKQTGSGTTILGSGATGTSTGGQLRMEGGHDFTNNGQYTQSGGAYFYSAGGSQSTVTNAAGGTWNLTVNNNTTYAYNDSSSAMNFVNAGTFAKVNASGVVYFGTSSGLSNFTNSASMTISGGTLIMNGVGTSTFGGTLALGDTAEIRFDRGTHTFSAGALITGNGVFYVYGSGANVTLTDGYSLKQVKIQNGVLNAGGTMTVESFSQVYGTYSSSADLTVTDTFAFAGGTATHNGTGTTIIASGATATFSSGNFYLTGNRDLINNGTMNQSGSMNFRSWSGSNSEITNAGGATWTLASNNGTTFIYNDSSSTVTFTNNGDLMKTSSGRVTFGTTSGSAIMVNNGNLDVSSGSLYFQSKGSATFSNASTLTIQTSLSTRGIEGNGNPLNFGGTLVLKATITPPTGQAVRVIDYDVRTGTFNTITPPQGLTVQTANYDDTVNDGRLEVTF